MRQRIYCFTFLAVSVGLMAGCAPVRTLPAYTPPNYGYTPLVPERPGGTTLHPYQVKVVDAEGAPMAGVVVKMSAEGEHTLARKEECTSDDQGMCSTFRYEVSRDPRLTYVAVYSSKFSVEGEKPGYYAGKASLSSIASNGATRPVTLRMLKPVDYLEDSLANSTADSELRGRVLTFLDVIRAQGFLNEAEVMLKGFGVSEFKGRKFLRVKVNSTTTYNNLKLNKYDVGKRLFDDTVRKMLSPLNSAIAAPRAFHGYDLVVYGHSKNFVERYAAADKHEYRFLMPEAAVRRYKDKDISGQALLDASIVLLDDERIDLKLQ